MLGILAVLSSSLSLEDSLRTRKLDVALMVVGITKKNHTWNLKRGVKIQFLTAPHESSERLRCAANVYRWTCCVMLIDWDTANSGAGKPLYRHV